MGLLKAISSNFKKWRWWFGLFFVVPFAALLIIIYHLLVFVGMIFEAVALIFLVSASGMNDFLSPPAESFLKWVHGIKGNDNE